VPRASDTPNTPSVTTYDTLAPIHCQPTAAYSSPVFGFTAPKAVLLAAISYLPG
jgi:hypothetical protein